MQHKIYACPSCSSTLRLQQNSFTCDLCNAIYPVVNDNIILLQTNPHQYLSDVKSFLQSQKEKIEHQKNLIAKNYKINARKAVASNYLAGLKHRIALFEILIKKLSSIPSPGLKEKSLSNFDTSYALPFKYLIRDLSISYQNDQEIEMYESCMNELFKESSITKDRICFLGSCSEQLPFRIHEKFKEIYTLEKSITVPLFMQLISEGAIDKLHEFQLKNIDIEDHAVVAHELKKPKFKNVKQIIADVQSLPFKDQSIDVFVSHYFSDTLPLHKYFPEIKRCLKPGGHFIHYGPLMYHFNKLDFMYSYEAFKNQIIKYGFEISGERENSSFHCKSKYVNQGRLITNKIFLAQLI